MISIPAQHVVAFFTVVLQFFVLSTDNLAGLSGADSIVRACLSSLDSSIGLMLLQAIYTFVREPSRDSRFRLKRLSLLHSQEKDLKAEIRLKIRPSWSRPFTNVTRTAVLSSAPVCISLIYHLAPDLVLKNKPRMGLQTMTFKTLVSSLSDSKSWRIYVSSWFHTWDAPSPMYLPHTLFN